MTSDAMDDGEALADLLKPIVAGARARGVADAFELLGIAAILMDSTGRVLHAASGIDRILEPAVRIVDGHLVGQDEPASNAIRRMIAALTAVPGQTTEMQDVVLTSRNDACELRIRPIRYPVDGDAQSQLLRAILLVSARAN